MAYHKHKRRLGMNNVYVTGDVDGKEDRLEAFFRKTCEGRTTINFCTAYTSLVRRFEAIQRCNEVWVVVTHEDTISITSATDISFAIFNKISVVYKENQQEGLNVLIIGRDYPNTCEKQRLIFEEKGHVVRKAMVDEGANADTISLIKWADLIICIGPYYMDGYTAQLQRYALYYRRKIIYQGDKE
jgi:hypothetical protein